MTTFTLEPQPARSSPGPLMICVFCGAAGGDSPAMVDVATTTGRLIGQRGHRLLYGGGGSGLMGKVAWAASRHGAAIRGVIPKFLYDKEQGIAAPDQELYLTSTLYKRKEHMLRAADVFIALPGGFGTLDEILEVISVNYLGVAAKPLVIVNPDGIWSGLIAQFETLRGLGLISGARDPLFHAVAAPEEALDLAESLVPIPT